MQSDHWQDTIIALSTPQGVGALAVIRLSGSKAVEIANRMFAGKDLHRQASHTVHVGTIRENDTIIDEVVVTLFRAPRSFTGEDVVEISCHGSMYIVKRIIMLAVHHGARLANPGEFTQRAFLNGRFDLAQAEAIADLIYADSEAARKTAMYQMRGGFSREIEALREELVHFASLIELELDFSEEDVEFASRQELRELVHRIITKISTLIDSFALGNVIKNGLPTVIAGKPNAGKSTLLNALLREERAIVSEIAGTTRDVIEDEMTLGGITFRFIDTAGLRDTSDKIEAIGVEKTRQKLAQAGLILFVFDLSTEPLAAIRAELEKLGKQPAPYLAIGNKADLVSDDQVRNFEALPHTLALSALREEDIIKLEEAILRKINVEAFNTGSTVVTNLRHEQALTRARQALLQVVAGIEQGLSNDLLALEIRQALQHLGEITGTITTDDLLANIFSKFCIGK